MQMAIISVSFVCVCPIPSSSFPPGPPVTVGIVLTTSIICFHVTRLNFPVLDVVHAACLTDSPGADCPSGCATPLISAQDDSPIAAAIANRLNSIPAMAAHHVKPVESIVNALPLTGVDDVTPDVKQSIAPLPAPASQPPPELSQQQTCHVESTPISSAISVKSSSNLIRPTDAPLDELSILSQVAPVVTQMETRLEIHAPVTKPTQKSSSGPSLKRDRNLPKSNMATSVRKAYKQGGRRWIDVKRYVLNNKRRVLVAVTFVFCIVVLWLLGSGDELDIAPATKPVLDDRVYLPHVRVNPAFVHHELPNDDQQVQVKEAQPVAVREEINKLLP